MERRQGLRGKTRFEVDRAVSWGWVRASGVELSSSGLVIDYGKIVPKPLDGLRRLAVQLPERARKILVWARAVRSYDTQEALRFVAVSDADRLTLAEHLDIVFRRGDLVAADSFERIP